MLAKLKKKLGNTVPYLVEGIFFKKLWSLIKHCFTTLRKKLDGFLAGLARRSLSKKTEINPKKILFTTFQGDYTCNLKYITEELLRQQVDCEIVWAVRESSFRSPHLFPAGGKLVQKGKYEYFREWCSAKVIVVNSVETFASYMPKKQGQFLLQTWHGSLGIKRFGKDKFWTLLNAAKKMAPLTDAIVSNSSFEDAVYKDTFWDKTPIWQFGHPRNDILIPTDGNAGLRERLAKKVREEYGIGEDEKVVLYAPTFRNACNVDCYSIDPRMLTEAFEKKDGCRWRLMIRLHPTVRKMSRSMPLLRDRNVIDATLYPDIQELMLVADAFITDYSSCIFDFVLSRRPGFIFATDIELYNNERGFYYRLEDTPFPVATNNQELLANVEAFDERAYLDRVEEFLKEKGCVEDGCASARVVEKIAEIMENKD